ncbi:hypothetical protein EIN_074360 [Entamoeba invadens IP1]|uniref:Uncharacterized protein n=1 Tax=Entamoeba invadens IP1 TaxID=370355 RepID=A0A0A1UF62_ENTIV|nr:hypothetical protein EIN_074360 [Entamoeba invadens IP1]ELP92593.1 hypothetical protein EIN_074360 [Entamoeba invadens IP1]|eukprot:XP_004259364.1 hypothetical protein EIN_074360 [Entamoeba invadens IP1]
MKTVYELEGSSCDELFPAKVMTSGFDVMNTIPPYFIQEKFYYTSWECKIAPGVHPDILYYPSGCLNHVVYSIMFSSFKNGIEKITFKSNDCTGDPEKVEEIQLFFCYSQNRTTSYIYVAQI